LLSEKPLSERHAGVDAAIDRAWALLTAAARWPLPDGRDAEPLALGFAPGGRVAAVGANDESAELGWAPGRGWYRLGAPDDDVAGALYDLYLPICPARAEARLTVGHLGQSLDGFIATRDGQSHYVTGPENIVHLHRMRALADAVIVGAETVAADDPLLTTRRVPGPSPLRVILDPVRRLGGDRRVLSGTSRDTVIVCDRRLCGGTPDAAGSARLIGVTVRGGRLDLKELLDRLHAEGAFRIFVEGGGTTVSGFLEAGLLDRLQLAVAPLVIGDGRAGLRLPPPVSLAECLRPAARVFGMGADVLFDCDLRAPAVPAERVTRLTRFS
jgi:diaminohydroxyphosphoribosylaminopyrimidine deaminase/5-amino-6-(5-phosphoribosylamino)uracil reductase